MSKIIIKKLTDISLEEIATYFCKKEGTLWLDSNSDSVKSSFSLLLINESREGGEGGKRRTDPGAGAGAAAGAALYHGETQ